MPVLKSDGHHGDLFVEVRVETPVKLTKKQKELLRAFEAESPKGCNPESETFFAKMKEFLGGGADRGTRPVLGTIHPGDRGDEPAGLEHEFQDRG